MSREEALEKALEELKEIRFNLNYKVNGTSRFDEALNMAIEALESESRMSLVQEAVNAILNTCNTDSIADKAMRNAAKFVQNAIDGSYPDFEKLPKWIPVSEGLPEIHNYCQLYLVTYEQGQICTAFYTETNGRSWWSIDGVEAWMSLPEPYKQEVEQ